MTPRIERLRNESLQAEYRISAERALLVTEFYQSHRAQQVSVPVRRALCLKYLFENKKLWLDNGELIVGERGPAPKATPSYPEVCLHSLQDLQVLNERKKVFFRVDNETRSAYRDVIIPFWTGKSTRDKLFENMTEEWLLAYKSGIFTEFQEQRAPGHTVCGSKIYHKGMTDIKNDIQKSIEKLDFLDDPLAFQKHEELKAMSIAADAIISLSNRYADLLETSAQNENDSERKAELFEMSRVCRKVPANRPESFHEALQYYWFVHLGVISELNPWDSFNPGRLDQHLYPFYINDLQRGILTEERAKELLQAFWIKFNNHPAPPKVGVTAEESNTYTDFALINLGGVKTDGFDGVNELTYIILDVIEEMRLLQPSSMVQVSKKNPDRFIYRTLQITKTGFGQPSIFNTEAIVQELMRQGKSVEDARNGGASGCVESGAFGTEAYILSGYFNLVKIFELTLNNGFDFRTQKQVGLQTGNVSAFSTINELLLAFEKQVKYFADIKIRGNNVIHRIFAETMPAPFLSLVVDDCIANAVDYNAGGARYNTTYIQGVGLGTLTDCFAAIEKMVFENKVLTMREMLVALQNNFEGNESLRHQLIYNAPKWGNDNDAADDFAKQIFEIYYNAVNERPTSIGGKHRINLLPTTCHVYFGKVTGATPDGRLSGEPLSEGISPVQGCDTGGPTSVIKSAAKLDHIRTGGTLLNQKFSPNFFEGETSIQKISALIRTYFRLDGHHIQFNVVAADTLRDAQKYPEKYRDLIVRVAGYSDYFNDLGLELQNEIINRTEHQSF